jgi:hypothetical protein
MSFQRRRCLLLTALVLLASSRAESKDAVDVNNRGVDYDIDGQPEIILPLSSLFGNNSPRRSLADLFNSLSGISQVSGHVVHLPPAIEGILEQMVSSGAMRRSLVQFSYADTNRTRLLAKISVPSAGDGGADRKIHIAVAGSGGHMRVRVETKAVASMATSFEHVIPLPVLVSPAGIETTAEVDGTVTVSLAIIAEKPSLNRLLGLNYVPLSQLLFGDKAELTDEDGAAVAQRADDDAVYAVPSAKQIEECVSKYASTEHRLLAKQCVCMASREENTRSLCFASLLSSAINVARRVSKDSFATDAKHQAIDCADHKEGKARCLEDLTSNVLLALHGSIERAVGAKKELKDQLRQALEMDDEGPSQPKGLTMSVRTLMIIVVVVLLVLALLGVGIFKAILRIGASSRRSGGRPQHRLSSVLSQLGSTSGDSNPNLGRTRPGRKISHE